MNNWYQEALYYKISQLAIFKAQIETQQNKSEKKKKNYIYFF